MAYFLSWPMQELLKKARVRCAIANSKIFAKTFNIFIRGRYLYQWYHYNHNAKRYENVIRGMINVQPRIPRAFAQKPWVRGWSNNGIQSVHCVSKWRVFRRDRLQCWTITCSCTWIRLWISKYSTLQSLFEFEKSCLKAICFRTIDSLKIRKYNPWSVSFFIFALHRRQNTFK
jgi:hypothetical protein